MFMSFQLILSVFVLTRTLQLANSIKHFNFLSCTTFLAKKREINYFLFTILSEGQQKHNYQVLFKYAVPNVK